MALEKHDTKHYQAMSAAERQAKAAEIDQLRDRPKAAVGFGSRLWTLTKTLGLAVIGMGIGHWVGGKLATTKLAESNTLVKWVVDHKKMVGMTTVAAVGVAHMHANRRNEVNDRADLEMAKITAADMEAYHQAQQSGQAVGTHTQRAQALRGGSQQQMGM